ncbi:hypothetical protein AAG570_005885 [Ranatra chinensis]|uniref:Transposase n=1 Tax=Ranatra chinensis TaxID=642074 RepID=A0ABD0YK52_9HEMI
MFYENKKQETTEISTIYSAPQGSTRSSEDDDYPKPDGPTNSEQETKDHAEFLANLQEQVLKNPGIGIRALSREMNVAASTMKLALNEDLRYYSYKRCKGQLLTEEAREKRLINAKKLLSKVKHPAEKNLWLASSTKDIPRVMQTKFPQTVMVLGCVSSEGDLMPPHFFREGLRLTSDGYVELLNTVVKPWIRRVVDGMPYVWQQDSAPRHTSRKSQKWLSENFYDFTSPNVWPPNSPDLNPIDYFVWGGVEKDTDRTPSNTKAINWAWDKIKTVFAAFPGETVASACSRFQSRIEAVIDANAEGVTSMSEAGGVSRLHFRRRGANREGAKPRWPINPHSPPARCPVRYGVPGGVQHAMEYQGASSTLWSTRGSPVRYGVPGGVQYAMEYQVQSSTLWRTFDYNA